VTSPFLVPDRDDGARVGRALSGSTFYSVPNVALSVIVTASAMWTANRDYYEFWYTPTPIIIDQLACEVSANGTNMRMGFYRADVNWQPIGAPFADSGNIDASTGGVKTYTPGSPIFVPRGRYLSVGAVDNSATTFKSFRGVGGATQMASGLGTNAFILNYSDLWRVPDARHALGLERHRRLGLLARHPLPDLDPMSTYQRRVEHYGPAGLINVELIDFELTGEAEVAYLAPPKVKQAYATLRQWSADAQAAYDDWPNKTNAQKDAATRETIRRLGVFFDRFADVLLLDGKS
jgi:hypothetical protein